VEVGEPDVQHLVGGVPSHLRGEVASAVASVGKHPPPVEKGARLLVAGEPESHPLRVAGEPVGSP